MKDMTHCIRRKTCHNRVSCITSMKARLPSKHSKGVKKILLGFLLTSLLAQPIAFADKSQMNEALVQMINQLQVMKPLINQAARSQPKNPRIKLHFNRWVDAKSKTHNGLRQDIEAIQGALIKAVNREQVEPRVFAPLNNDFVESHGGRQP